MSAIEMHRALLLTKQPSSQINNSNLKFSMAFSKICPKKFISAFKKHGYGNLLCASLIRERILRKYLQLILSGSNKSPTRYSNFSVYYPGVYLQLNMFREFPRPSSGAQ
jgi:hypothetical protein